MPMTIRLRAPAELVTRCDQLAERLERSRNDLIVEALQEYLAAEEEDLRLTDEAIAAADRGELTPTAEVREEMVALLERHGLSREEQAAMRARRAGPAT